MKVTSSPVSQRMPKIAAATASAIHPAPTTPRSWMPRPAYVAMAFVLSLTLGLGTIRLFNLPAPVNDDAELADLAQFESDTPDLGSSEPSSSRSSQTLLGERPQSRPPVDAAAWLIGTIESDDAAEQIALPPRVSQTSADGSLPRSSTRPATARGPALVTH